MLHSPSYKVENPGPQSKQALWENAALMEGGFSSSVNAACLRFCSWLERGEWLIELHPKETEGTLKSRYTTMWGLRWTIWPKSITKIAVQFRNLIGRMVLIFYFYNSSSGNIASWREVTGLSHILNYWIVQSDWPEAVHYFVISTWQYVYINVLIIYSTVTCYLVDPTNN